MASLRTRAASLLRSSFLAPPETIEEEPNEGKLPTSSVPQDLEYHALTEKSPCDDQTSNGELSMSISSAGKTLNTCNTATIENDIDVQRLVRAVPSQYSCSVEIFIFAAPWSFMRPERLSLGSLTSESFSLGTFIE